MRWCIIPTAQEYERRFEPEALREMYRRHALPMGWETMEFDEFLKVRRGMIAETVREAYEKLSGQAASGQPSAPSAGEIIGSGEAGAVEFKSTLRTNMHTGEKDARMETAVLKSIAGFLNSAGGTLIIGVADDGSPTGLSADGFASEDKMGLHLINLLKERIGGQHALNVHPGFDDHEGARVLVVECDRSKTPVFMKDGPTADRFFVRYGPSTLELIGANAQEFITQRFQ